MNDLSPRLSDASLQLREGNRMAALVLLRAAVALDPLDLTAHRRLAAVLANSGDLQGAFDEHARYRESLGARGDLDAFQNEVAYAAATLGKLMRPRLLGESQKPSVPLHRSRSTRSPQRLLLLVWLVNGLLVLTLWAMVSAPGAGKAAPTTPTPTSPSALSTVLFAPTAGVPPTPSVASTTPTPEPATASMPVASPTLVLAAPSPSATIAPTAIATTSSILATPSPAPIATATPAPSIGAHGRTERDAHSNAVGKPSTNAHSANGWPGRRGSASAR